MTNITITNARTATKKLRNILLAGLIIGGAYFGRDVVKNAISQYERYNAYSLIESKIDDEDYTKARERLSEFGGYLTPEEAKDLEAKIQSIYPDSLLVKSQTESLERQKELTLKAREAYIAMGKETFEANKKYVEALLNELVSQLNQPFMGRLEDPIISNLELVKNDTVFKELINLNTKKPKIYEPILNNFISATGNYIKSFNVEKYAEYFKYIQPAITYTLDISFGINPSRHRDDVKFLIDTYSELAKWRMERGQGPNTVLKTLSTLKKLQEVYKYKNQIIDEDKLLLEYIPKL